MAGLRVPGYVRSGRGGAARLSVVRCVPIRVCMTGLSADYRHPMVAPQDVCTLSAAHLAAQKHNAAHPRFIFPSVRHASAIATRRPKPQRPGCSLSGTRTGTSAPMRPVAMQRDAPKHRVQWTRASGAGCSQGRRAPGASERCVPVPRLREPPPLRPFIWDPVHLIRTSHLRPALCRPARDALIQRPNTTSNTLNANTKAHLNTSTPLAGPAHRAPQCGTRQPKSPKRCPIQSTGSITLARRGAGISSAVRRARFPNLARARTSRAALPGRLCAPIDALLPGSACACEL